MSCSEPDDRTVRLELWTLALRPTFTEYVEKLIDGFEAAHPEVEIEWVDVPFDALNRKLVAAAAADRPPDVVNFSDLQFARFASLGAMADLTDRLPNNPDARYQAGALSVGRLEGELLGLPWYLTTPVRMVNVELLTAGGLATDDLGSTWPVLREQARTYHHRTGGFLFSLPLGQDSALPGMLLADGLVPFKLDGTGRLRADLTRPEVVEAVSAWVDLYRGGAMPRAAATSGHAHLVDLYQNGETAVVQTGPNFLSRIADAAPDVYQQTRVLPAATGTLGRSHISVMLLAVSSGSEHPDLAAELAWWMTSPENQLAFAKIVNILPSTPASLDDAHFDRPLGSGDNTADVNQRLALARAISAESLRDAVAFTPALATWPDLRRAFDERIKSALLDGADVAQTLATVEADWNALLAAATPVGMDGVPVPGPIDGSVE